MISVALEFAPGTTEDCQKVILGMFEPAALLRAYRVARREHNTPDVVLVCPTADPSSLFAGPRNAMRVHLERVLGPRANKLAVYSQTAHTVVKMPLDSDAMWLVVQLPGYDLPLMAVLYAVPYEQVSSGAPLVGEA